MIKSMINSGIFYHLPVIIFVVGFFIVFITAMDERIDDQIAIFFAFAVAFILFVVIPIHMGYFPDHYLYGSLKP